MSETLSKKDNAFVTYLKKIFTKKQLITKGIILAAAILIVVIPAVSFYATWANAPVDQYLYQGTFINIIVHWNSGIATSAMSGNYAGIYAVQSIVFILLVAIFLFLTQDKVSCSFVALAIVGGFFNLIQRAGQAGQYANHVFDYIQFKPWLQWMSLGNTIFNWPDMGVVVGVIGFLISYIIHIILQVTREKKKDKELADKAKAYEQISKVVKETEKK